MHMFCKKCGKELEDNVRFCNYCGTEVGSNVVEFKGAFGDKEPENSESSEPQYKYEYVSPEQVSQKAVEEPVEKDVTINIAGHKINGRLIMKIAAIVAAACFFFPMFTVSCAGVNVGSVSMADLTFGTEDTTQDSYYDYYDSDEEENGTVGMIVFLLAPISAFCICMVKNEGKKKAKLKDIFMLQIVIAIYTLSTVCAKFASGQEFMSFQFILYYGLEMVILGVYAIVWQQLIKKFEISVAYANKAMGLLWSIVWAILIFKDTVTIKNVIGVVIVIIGTMIVNSEDE